MPRAPPVISATLPSSRPMIPPVSVCPLRVGQTVRYERYGLCLPGPNSRTCSCFGDDPGVESGTDGTQRGLRRGGRGQRRMRARQTAGRVGRQRHPARGRRPGPHPAGAQAGDDRHLPQRAGPEEAPGLGLLHRPAGGRARPPDPAAARPGARRLRLDQRHGLRPRQPAELRRLGRGRVQGLVVPRRAAQLQADGGLGRRRQRAARRRRADQGHQAAGPDPAVGEVHRGARRDRRGAADRRLQRRVAGGRVGLPAERQRRAALQLVGRVPGRSRPARPDRLDRRARRSGSSSRAAAPSGSRSSPRRGGRRSGPAGR